MTAEDACVVDIRGASGNLSRIINGIYDKIEEIHDGKPVFAKRDSMSLFLIYDLQTNYWYVTPSNNLRRKRAWMKFIGNPYKIDSHRPYYEVFDGVEWTKQSTVSIWTLEDRFEDDKRLGYQRRNMGGSIEISGIIGPLSYSLEGVYFMSMELSGGWPLYFKPGYDFWIEYSAIINEWIIKPATSKSKLEGWICFPNFPSTFIDECNLGCEVWDGENWHYQSKVCIRRVPSGFKSMRDFRYYCEMDTFMLQGKLLNSLYKCMEMLNISEEEREQGNIDAQRLLETTKRKLSFLKQEIDDEVIVHLPST